MDVQPGWAKPEDTRLLFDPCLTTMLMPVVVAAAAAAAPSDGAERKPSEPCSTDAPTGDDT